MCVRITFESNGGILFTGRSLDWRDDPLPSLWALPEGITRTGNAGPNSITWTSRYGSIATVLYDISTNDAMNSQGLSVSALYLTESDYGTPLPGRKNLNVLSWAQYVLDNFATVDETVKELKKDEINIIPFRLPNGRLAVVRLAITDAAGNNAVIEYIKGGKLSIYRGKEYTTVANSPYYPQQLEIYKQWNAANKSVKPPDTNLPGSGQSASRFTRACYYLELAQNNQPEEPDMVTAISTVFSILRNISTPFNFFAKQQEDVDDHIRVFTRCRLVADLTHKIYYFEATNKPNIVWIDLSRLNLNKGAEVKRLPLSKNEIYTGEVSGKFVPYKPFVTPSTVDPHGL